VIFIVREATATDLPRLADIKVGNWEDTYSTLVEPDVLRPFLDRDAQLAELSSTFQEGTTLLLVAEDESGDVVGFALTYIDHRPDPWLESLHVARASRGIGAGTTLMRATALHLLDRGHRTLRLGVVEGNDAAARFYDRLGAMKAGRERASWARGVWHEIYRWDDISRLA
jgi:ribosomal protein S18 acetylase RimI-like enzyme